MDLEWTDEFPSKDVLRREVQAMVDAYVGALTARIPPAEITGIYMKGSARKAWDSPIDYVPELSDVDVHLLMRDDEDVERRLGGLDAGLAVLADADRAFNDAVPSPVHVPRCQLIILNRLLDDPDYWPSPPGGVETLYGEPYAEKWNDDEAALRRLDAKRMLDNEEVVAKYPLRVIDKPGPHMRFVLRDMSWRVSPTGPRALTLLGVSGVEAWTANRTRIVALLGEHGEVQLARDYVRFYRAGWDFFLSRYADSAPAREAVAAGVAVLERGMAIARRS